ncbi:hypothetical protein BY447_4192 [Pantoea sp. JKS000250]|nr:hypothetical protein BY447_4192 [Pantoea sp. JKS000250]
MRCDSLSETIFGLHLCELTYSRIDSRFSLKPSVSRLNQDLFVYLAVPVNYRTQVLIHEHAKRMIKPARQSRYIIVCEYSSILFSQPGPTAQENTRLSHQEITCFWRMYLLLKS